MANNTNQPAPPLLIHNPVVLTEEPEESFKTITHDLYHAQTFLNKPESSHSGSVHIHVRVKELKDEVYIDADFMMRDCNRRIDLSIDTDERSLNNTLFKIDTLLSEVTKFKEAFLKAIELKNKLMEERKK